MKIPGQYFKQATNASFHILSHSPFLGLDIIYPLEAEVLRGLSHPVL